MGPHTTRKIDVVIVGAGHAGLAMSYCLNERGVDHVVLERADIANSWRTERWDSLRLLTPNWQARLPGMVYEGDDPDGFLTVPQVSQFIASYAEKISVPLERRTNVLGIKAHGSGYLVETSQGDWQTRGLVLASGACNKSNVPLGLTESLSDSIDIVHAIDYRNPDQLAEGGVLVVGAAATGTQLALEVQRSGRPVTLAVGEHVRLPRIYRERDIFYWMEAVGLLDEDYKEVDDIKRARNVSSPQLIGSPEHVSLGLNELTKCGVKLIGRYVGLRRDMAQFSGSLRNHCALADLKMNRLLKRIDEWILEEGPAGDVPEPHRFDPTQVEESPPLEINLANGDIGTILWATGFHPDYDWLHVPVFDRKGRIRHDGGVVDAPGMYLLGVNFLRRRKSSFIHGAEDDANDLSDHLAAYLAA
ncbi:MAG: NAD(P)-binding domain-containing protein [Arenicellales bacterium]|nr:NAD(P)-binding domain-containing protein [Arenicellales bacterium]